MREAIVEAAAGSVVPENSIAVAGKQHRDGDVGVVLRNIYGFAAIVPDARLVLAQTVERFLRSPHVDEPLRMKSFFSIYLNRFEAACILFRQLMSGRVLKNQRAVFPVD